MKKVIAYYRVSTNDQNLGVSAQKEIVRRYCEFNSADIISDPPHKKKNPDLVKYPKSAAETR